MFTKAVLPNGVRVISVPMDSIQSATALVLIKTGSRYETNENRGISHLFEHLAFKRTKKYPQDFQIHTILDGLGSTHNAFTGKEYTGFYVKSEGRHLEKTLDILTDLITTPIFTEKDLETEKKAVVEEINMYEDEPQSKVGELFEELLFAPNPLGLPIAGTKESVLAITSDQVKDYVKKQYVGENVVVVLSGRTNSHPGVSEANDRVFKDSIATLQNDTKETKGFDKFISLQSTPKSNIFYKKTDQAHLCLGFRGYDINHPDRYTLSLLATILGGNASSRLFIEIREKRGLAYYVGTGADEYADTGYFVTQAGLKLDSVEEAIKVILEQQNNLKNNLVLNSDLQRAKDYFRGKLALSLEDSFKVANFYGSQELLENKIEMPEQVLAHIEAVTVDDIKRVANDIFVDQKLNLALIGPFQDKGKFDKLLTI